MRIRRLTVKNFRGIESGLVDFTGNTLIVGGNNIGKSTICEALDLVLGPERLYRRPVVNEHDFYQSRYVDHGLQPVDIRIEAILLDLSEVAQRRFCNHLRRWNDLKGCWADEEATDPQDGDAVGTSWALPVLFIGRYDAVEDDFAGNTFFAHPQAVLEEIEDEETRLGAGLKVFSREHKRLAGFLFLRTLRTGSRALSMQRGSLLDTILRLGGAGVDRMWQDSLNRLRNLSPPIGASGQLQKVRAEVQKRMANFINLASEGDPTAFFASQLTREHLREVVQFFVASDQTNHLVPFHRQGTGTINILVFALLTFIAELREKNSVIFAMEEPEVALPPHTQRRVVRFLLREMGQTLITSHSPYVIEQFEPGQIVMLNRVCKGTLSGKPIDTLAIKTKTFKTERRQFAEAVLSQAVLVVEGATEAAIFPAASTVLEQVRGSDLYTHFDLAGVTIFNAGGDGSVPRYGPIFKALGKLAFALYDKPSVAHTVDTQAMLSNYTKTWESPYPGVENLLANETPSATLRRFLESVKDRPDYPSNQSQPATSLTDDEIRNLALKVLKDRKGETHAYGALLIAQCKLESELPRTILSILDTIQAKLAPHLPEPLMKSTAELGPESVEPAD